MKRWKIDRQRGPWQTEGEGMQRYRNGPQRGEFRELMIEIHPRYIVYRERGTQARFMLPHSAIYQKAVEAHVAANRKPRRRSVRRSAIGNI